MADHLSYQALESLWTSAGGPVALAPTMAAIAIAESGGRPDALNDNPSTGDYSVGLWQINYFDGMRAERTREFGSPDALRASPTAQARAAVAIYRQQGLRAWSTYTGGDYRRYMGGANYSGTGVVSASGANWVQPALLSTDKPADCLIGFPAGIGYVCLMTKGQGRAIFGGLLIFWGGGLGVAGLVILTAYGLKKTGVLDTAAQAASVLPGAGGMAARLASASGALKSSPAPRPKGQQKQSTPDTETVRPKEASEDVG